MRFLSKLKGVFVKTVRTSVGTRNESNRIQWIENKLSQIPSGYRILDAGAGEQPFKKYCSHLKYVSQDFARYNPGELDKGLQMGSWDYGELNIVSDISSIPEPDASFDAIMCTEVFEHIINPREALKEFSRLLRKDGYLIITAPFCSLTHFAPYHYYTGFSKYFYEIALNDNGFKILEITPNGDYFNYLAQEIIRLPSIANKYSADISKKDRKTLINTLKILENLSKTDTGSSDLLYYGNHVFAQKL